MFDPVAELSELRDGSGVARVRTHVGEAWLVTRLVDVRAVLGDDKRFSNSFATDPDQLRAGDPLFHDPPAHTRLRRLLAPEFSIARTRRLEPRIRQIIDQRLDVLEHQGPPADLIKDFAFPVPALVICELLGVPFADRAEFQARSSRICDLSLPSCERARANRESREYMSGLVARARLAPGEDILGRLVREHGDELADDELSGMAAALLFAGHETTASMLGLGTLALLRHPDQLALIRDDPERIDTAVEELLRWLSIAHTTVGKTTTTEVEIAGQRIAKGARVLCVLSSANRDPHLVSAPDDLDVTRKATRHVAFGYGIHYCLGAPLARVELQLAFSALFRRFPTLRTADAGPVFRAANLIFGLDKLPVTWNERQP
jgi:cytochrome P450